MADRLNSGERLNRSARLTSQNGQFFLILQDDGNLVLYTAGGSPLSATGTTGARSETLIMQGDGNLVIYGPGGSVVWALDRLRPAPPRIPGAWLVVQDDGNMVIYDPSGRAICATGTNSSVTFENIGGHAFAAKRLVDFVKGMFKADDTGGHVDTDTCDGCHSHHDREPGHPGGVGGSVGGRVGGEVGAGAGGGGGGGGGGPNRSN